MAQPYEMEFIFARQGSSHRPVAAADQWKSLNEVYLQIPKSLPTPMEKEHLINNPRAYLDRNGRLSSVTATLHEVDDDEYGQCLYN